MTPLVDLHRHLEGSIRPATSVELATRIGTDLTSAKWRAALVAADREEGLLPYLAKIENATVLVRTLDDWRRVIPSTRARRPARRASGLPSRSPRGASGTASGAPRTPGCLRTWPPLHRQPGRERHLPDPRIRARR
jgi:hypothetical protein